MSACTILDFGALNTELAAYPPAPRLRLARELEQLPPARPRGLRVRPRGWRVPGLPRLVGASRLTFESQLIVLSLVAPPA